MLNWLQLHLFHLIIPVLVFITVVVFGLWGRLALRTILRKPRPKTTWVHHGFVLETLWHPVLLWFIFLGIYIAIEISILAQATKHLAAQGLASLFCLSFMWTAINLSGRLIRFYVGKTEATQSLNSVAVNIIRTTIIVIGLLVLFDIWGVPTFPITLILIAGLFIVVFSFRTTLDNLLAGLEIAYGEHIKIGHFIKLGSGETGHVTKISWTRTTIQTTEGSLVIIPNYKLMATIIVNHNTVAAGPTINDIQKYTTTIKAANLVGTLSDRERDVLRLIRNGLTNREIAEKLFLSEHTVKSHLRSILSKLNIRNRQQAAAFAEREGLGSEASITYPQ